MRERRIGILAVLAAAMTILLSGCVSIPTTGDVTAGREVSEQEPGPIEFFTEGPIAGADQETILRGFVAAFSGSGNYEVARQFLSRSLAEKWDPRASVLVRTGTPRMTPVDEDTIEYFVTANAAVDAQGVYATFPAASQAMSFSFVQEQGEWRINAAPDGIVLSSRTFTDLFAEHALYFYDLSREHFVPDLRWFPTGAAPTKIVSALLEGPPPWLQGAVTTAFPSGTQLTSPKRVSVDSGLAVVDLTPEALIAPEPDRQLMRNQLRASLAKVASGVSISVGGTELALGQGDPMPMPRPHEGRALVLRTGEFGYFAGAEVVPLDGLSTTIAGMAPRSVTVSNDGSAAVLANDAGVYQVGTRLSEPRLIDGRAGLVDPGLDNFGFAWSGAGNAPETLRVFDRDGFATDIPTGIPADTTLVAFEVSPDGARIALLVNGSTGARVLVAGVVRDAGRAWQPTTLGPVKLDAVIDEGQGVDVTWIDEVSVGTVTASGSGALISSFEVGGIKTALGEIEGAAGIVGAHSAKNLRVITADGLVFTQRGASWQPGARVSVLARQL